ncbi:cleavage and polyadenylation specificity factor subunit 1 isoform X2 [Salvia miltiorrhiza]|uniref:cleavage and polyadenylation specificity factor subunit 1 isoform X2 n=1 Tax=Salvia miltiorrhiza TaxID=226208 RepID=UPI0025AC6E4D|nr:cleavage and polyadenylation specificity factor subunit 1 isoform X2 [Salvia miltiorrhiza]
MSFAAFKMMHWATGIEHCAAGFITHSSADFTPKIPPITADDIDSDWSTSSKPIGSVPNLIIAAANVLEVYILRIQEEASSSLAYKASAEPKGGGVLAGICGASLELVCHYRLHGNVESLGVLPNGAADGGRRKDSIILTFRDAKISVLEFDDSIHGLRTSSMHCFEGSDWIHLRRGREFFPRGPLVKVDPLGRCAAVLVYGLQMIVLKAAEASSGLAAPAEDSTFRAAGASRIESSYIVGLRDLDMKHVKDFIFIHGYIEPVVVILHEHELTWAGRVSWKHHTCMISALSVSTTLKQHPLIWSAMNLPHDAYKLLAVPSPIGGVLVIGANTIHYHSQSASCHLGLNNFAVPADGSQEMPRSGFTTELDAATATWLTNDVAVFSTKSGELLLLTLVYDGRVVQRLELIKSRASVLTSDITTIGSSFFFLGSRLGDSLLVQYYSGLGAPTLTPGVKEEVGDIESDAPTIKRLRRSPSDALQDLITSEELSFYGTGPNNAQIAQKNFTFAVRDSLLNIGPLKDFSYGLRISADPNATGVAKQSNYELVCCSGHGKNGALTVLQKSIRPDTITQESLPGCKGIWTVYHKNLRSDSSKGVADEDEYHAYLIISLENRTMVLQTANNLEEVTENVDYYVQGTTIAAGNLFGRRRVIQIFARGARILDGAFMTQDLSLKSSNTEMSAASEGATVSSVSIADPYVLLRMTDGSIQLLVGDPSTCSVSVINPPVSENSDKLVLACTLYHDKGPEPWIRKTSTDAWLSTGLGEAIDGADGSTHDHGDVYCVLCYDNGDLEIFDVPNFNSVFLVDKFVSGRSHILDTFFHGPANNHVNLTNKFSEDIGQGRKDATHNIKVVELSMQRWDSEHNRPFLFGILSDGTILCYHAYIYEVSENASKTEGVVSSQNSVNLSSTSASRLRNLRFVRVPLDTYAKEETPSGVCSQRITVFKNVGGLQGLFLSGSRPAWFMMFRERLRMHPQGCDGPIVAFTVLHNVNCNHGFICITSEGALKICQLPALSSYDNYWPVQKIGLKGTPHQVTYFAEKNLYPVIVSVPVLKPLNQVLSSLVDQEVGNQFEHDNMNTEGTYPMEEFEVRIMEPEKINGPWQTRATIPMQSSEHAITVRVVTLFNTTAQRNETLLAIGTAYVQGEDVAARGRILLYSVERNSDSIQAKVSEVYAKELKGAISALASLQGHLLLASGPKIILHKWTGSELNGVAFYDVPPLYVVSLNIVKNFILLGDIHKSIYFLSWKEQGSQLNLLAKDFGSLDCLATEFLIDGSTLSLTVSDDQKNVQIFYYAPKVSESWKGQKLLSRAEFHVGAHITKFLRLQLLPTSADRTTPGSDKTNRFGLLFGTLEGSIGCIAPLDELTFRRLQSLQKKLVDSVCHVAGLNPRSFRHFHSNGKAHRPGPDSIVDCELLVHFEMLTLEDQLEIANQIGTTRMQIMSNLNDLSLATSFL